MSDFRQLAVDANLRQFRNRANDSIHKETYFARQGKAGPVQWLLEHGAGPDARNKNGMTAAEIGRTHAGIVRLLTKS